MSVAVERLRSLWASAASRPAESSFRTAEIDVRTDEGVVLVGVDVHDHKHLLVPVSSKHRFKEDVEGRAVRLRRRGLEDEQSFRYYASLELVDEQLDDLFPTLCAEVVERIERQPETPVRALLGVLREWRDLLAGERETLSSTALAGLFGELLLLRRMVDVDPSATTSWTGPSGSAKDFHRGRRSLEVKATTRVEGRNIRVHGVDQLEVIEEGRLYVHWVRLSTASGRSVPGLVDDLVQRVDDVASFRKLLRLSGYRESERSRYETRLFEVIEERTYRVGPGFPRIIARDLVGDAILAGVGPVDYDVDLDSAPAEAMRLYTNVVTEFFEDAR